MELLQQLTVCNPVSDEIEDHCNWKCLIEKKFVRCCGKAGHIEDVVVDLCARGMKLGKKLIGFLVDHTRSMGCYKVILDCSAGNKAFFEKCGFKEKEIQMVKYFI
nr:glucosamine 6-phosphate N-acetyltransferase [Tanacetum cinerariifolium]